MIRFEKGALYENDVVWDAYFDRFGVTNQPPKTDRPDETPIEDNFCCDSGIFNRVSWWLAEKYISPVYTYIGAAIFAAFLVWLFWPFEINF